MALQKIRFSFVKRGSLDHRIEAFYLWLNPVSQGWERLNHSCKIIITAGLRFTLAKGVLTTFFLMCRGKANALIGTWATDHWLQCLQCWLFSSCRLNVWLVVKEQFGSILHVNERRVTRDKVSSSDQDLPYVGP